MNENQEHRSFQFIEEKEINETKANKLLEKAKKLEEERLKEGYSFKQLDKRTTVLTKDIDKSKEKYKNHTTHHE